MNIIIIFTIIIIIIITCAWCTFQFWPCSSVVFCICVLSVHHGWTSTFKGMFICTGMFDFIW